MATIPWEPVGRSAPRTLSEARLQLHWATQVAASVGHTFLPPAPDDSQSTLQWDQAHRLLVGHPVGTDRQTRAAIDPTALSLVLLEGRHGRLVEFSMNGQTLEGAYGWMSSVVKRFSGAPGPIRRRDYTMPAHPVGTGATFSSASRAELEELTRWYANAHHALSRVRVQASNASAVRCWPHHFDIATLISLEPDQDSEQARSVNVGLSPGDDSYDEPYWYVTPYPSPEAPELAELGCGGHWHTDGWFGAVLQGTDLVAAGKEASAQADVLNQFLDSALAAVTRILVPPTG